MSFNFASAKLAMRRKVHSTFGVSAFYRDSIDTVEQPIFVRWHDTQTLPGELDDDGYAEVVDTENKLIFQPDLHPAVTLRANGIVRIPPALGVGTEMQFTLILREPITSPPNETWQVNPR